jgi:hypothetical protein
LCVKLCFAIRKLHLVHCCKEEWRGCGVTHTPLLLFKAHTGLRWTPGQRFSRNWTQLTVYSTHFLAFKSLVLTCDEGHVEMASSCNGNQFSQSGSVPMSPLIPFTRFQHSTRSYFHSPFQRWHLLQNIYVTIWTAMSWKRTYILVHLRITFNITAASVRMTVFWDVAPYSLVEVYRCFRSAYCLYRQDYELWRWQAFGILLRVVSRS